MMTAIPDFTLSSFLELANGGALLLFLFLLIKGLVVPKVVVDQMMEESKNQTLKLVNEISATIEGAVKNGVLQAHAERDNKTKE
jgi:hypothetical protein